MDNWLEVGTIVGAVGLQGELKIHPSSDFPDRFQKQGQRWLKDPKNNTIIEVKLLSGRYLEGKNLYVIKLAEVKDRSEAEAFRGYQLLVDAKNRPLLEEEEYHVADLIGLEVYHQLTKEKIGEITDIYFAGNDLLEVELIGRDREKNKKILIPFVREIVPIVELGEHRLEINPPPGLLELN